MTINQSDSRALEAVLRHFKDAKVLSVTGDVIRFASKQDLAFVKGGWIEQYVYRTVTALHGTLGIRDKVALAARLQAQGAQGMLVSYRAVGDSEKRLAKALGIELVCGAELNRLAERITAWVRVVTC